MEISKIIDQYRRDFTAVYKCENCGNEKEDSGYDDRNFHDNAVPKMKCEKCGMSSLDLGTEIKRVATKYPDEIQI